MEKLGEISRLGKSPQDYPSHLWKLLGKVSAWEKSISGDEVERKERQG
jgi:hypothetical protein